MLEPDVVNRIRAIFLHQRPHVSIAEATVLLGWSRGEMSRASGADEIEIASTELGKWIWREELMAKALEVFPLETIEEALGADADSVLPEAVRLTEVRVRLPRYHAAMLAFLAERNRTTVSEMVTRELDGVASAHFEELASGVTGFADALAWPDGERAPLPC